MGDVSLNHQPLINEEPLPLPSSTAKKGDQVQNLMSPGWTNERHNSYISSMEASFVDQLYGHQNHGLDANKRLVGASGFKVIQEGVCKNMRFERADARARDGGTNTSYLPDNPWVRRFRPRSSGVNRRGNTVDAVVDDYGSGTDTVREKVRTHGREEKPSVDGNIFGKSKEVTDQNFADEEVVETENESCKKQRPTSSDAAPNDQGT